MQQDKMIHDGAICAISCFIHGILSIAAMYTIIRFYIATSQGRLPKMAIDIGIDYLLYHTFLVMSNVTYKIREAY